MLVVHYTCPVSSPAAPAESISPPFQRIIKVDHCRIEQFRLEVLSDPHHHLSVLLVARVLDRFEKVPVSMHTAAILRRTSPFAVEAARIRRSVLPWQDLFKRDRVLPIVAVAVDVRCGRVLVGRKIDIDSTTAGYSTSISLIADLTSRTVSVSRRPSLLISLFLSTVLI